MERGLSALNLGRRGSYGGIAFACQLSFVTHILHRQSGSRPMLNDEAGSLRISSSPVHRRVSKPNLADVNPPLALLAR